MLAVDDPVGPVDLVDHGVSELPHVERRCDGVAVGLAELALRHAGARYLERVNPDRENPRFPFVAAVLIAHLVFQAADQTSEVASGFLKLADPLRKHRAVECLIVDQVLLGLQVQRVACHDGHDPVRTVLGPLARFPVAGASSGGLPPRRAPWRVLGRAPAYPASGSLLAPARGPRRPRSPFRSSTPSVASFPWPAAASGMFRRAGYDVPSLPMVRSFPVLKLPAYSHS